MLLKAYQFPRSKVFIMQIGYVGRSEIIISDALTMPTLLHFAMLTSLHFSLFHLSVHSF